MKKTLALALSAVVVLTVAPSAQAKQIVHDPRSLASQLIQWKSQLEEMRAQVQQGQQLIGQGQQLYNSLNQLSNVNSIGAALNNPQLRQFLPEDALALGRAVDGDFSALGSIGQRADNIRETNRLYRPGEAANSFDQAGIDALNRTGNLAARDIAVGEQVDATANRRLQGIEELRRALDTATTARAVMDIQARISAETALLQNDNMRLQGQAIRASAERELEVQRSRERQLEESRQRRAIYARQ